MVLYLEEKRNKKFKSDKEYGVFVLTSSQPMTIDLQRVCHLKYMQDYNFYFVFKIVLSHVYYEILD